MTTPSSPSPEDAAAFVNQNRGGWNETMGLIFERVSADAVVGVLEIAEQHRQPYGIVHGGVHAGIIEAACSTGAAMAAMRNGQSVVGLENATSFLRAARAGKVRVTARPLTRGRRTQVWEAVVEDEGGRVLASGRVRLLCIDPGATVAGGPLDVGG